MAKLAEILLRTPLKNVNNAYGSSWFSRSNFRKKYERLLRKEGYVRKAPFRFSCRLVVTRILGPKERFWDHANLGYSSYKELQDSLVATGWFQDDAPKYISHVEFRQDDSRRSEGPAILIEIFSSHD